MRKLDLLNRMYVAFYYMPFQIQVKTASAKKKYAFACALAFALLTLAAKSVFAQSQQELLIQSSRDWLKSISVGDRTKLDAIMDPSFVATTPAGDVLGKDRLVPSDSSQPVQTMPPLKMGSPMVRVYGETGVLMARLKGEGSGPELNATFAFSYREHTWKLVALQLSPQK